MNKKLVILIAGKKGTGKSTLAKTIADNLILEEVKHIGLSFAGAIKDTLHPMIEKEFGSYILSDSSQKEFVRGAYKAWGKIGRHIRKSFWIDKVIDSINKSNASVVIIDDARFENELMAFEEFTNIKVKMDRKSIFPVVDTDESEVGLDNVDRKVFDYHVTDVSNNDEMRELFRLIGLVLIKSNE